MPLLRLWTQVILRMCQYIGVTGTFQQWPAQVSAVRQSTAQQGGKPTDDRIGVIYLLNYTYSVARPAAPHRVYLCRLPLTNTNAQ